MCLSTNGDTTAALCHAWCITGSPRRGPGLHLTISQLGDTVFCVYDSVHLTEDPSPARIGDIGAKKGIWGKKQKVPRKWEAESHLFFKEQYSNREVRNEDRGVAVWKENNSQLLRGRMPWLQTDWAINRLIIYSLLIASVRGPSVRSLISTAPCILTHHTQACLWVFSCVSMHGSESWPPARDVCVWLEHADSGLHSGRVERQSNQATGESSWLYTQSNTYRYCYINICRCIYCFMCKFNLFFFFK